MPRTARKKISNGIYHIIMRGATEITLFKSDTDKRIFLKYVKKYKDIFNFDILAYCLMNTHVHILLYSKGADVSKFMQGINQSYTQHYYNKKYDRHGHVFSDRFKSKIAKDDNSILNMSAYIHNNPKDIKGYRKYVENYKYSSLGIYLCKRRDDQSIVNPNKILKYFHKDPIQARKRYLQFVRVMQISEIDKTNLKINTSIDEIDINNYEMCGDLWEYSSGKTILKRDANPYDILNFISRKLNISQYDLQIKYNRKISEYRAISILLMRCFCDFKFSDINKIISNLTVSSLSKLCNKGYDLVKYNKSYRELVNQFLLEYPAT